MYRGLERSRLELVEVLSLVHLALAASGDDPVRLLFSFLV